MTRWARPRASPADAVRRGAAFEGGARTRIGLPGGAVLVALLVADLLRAVFPAGGVFLLLLVPVLVASVGVGARSGLLALGLGVAGALALAALRDHPWLAGPTDLLRIVPFVCIGGFVVLVGQVLRASVRHRSPFTSPLGPANLVEQLTGRELEVLSLAASGLTTDEIAGSLVVSRNTVKSHLAHAYGKLGVRNRAEAVAMALYAGAIDRAVVTSRVEAATEAEMAPAGRSAESTQGQLPLRPAMRPRSPA